MDDEEAARCILNTFAEETRKNIIKMNEAIDKGDTTEICAIAHKMLPTFIMIEAREAIPALQWLDEHKNKGTDPATAEAHAHTVIRIAQEAIEFIQSDSK